MQLVGISRKKSVSSSDRKSTRLNSSHTIISYAVFCLKKKKNTNEVQCISSIANGERRAGACDRAYLPYRALLPLLLCCLSAVSFPFFLFFFFKGSGPPGIFPFSPPRPFPV